MPQADSGSQKSHARALRGHNYQLMDFGLRQIANFEVAHDQVSEKVIRQAFFHANQYQTLQVPDQRLAVFA